MLPKAIVVNAKEQFAKLYDDTCVIKRVAKVRKPNGSIVTEEVIEYKDIPCRLSYRTSENSNIQNGVATVNQIIKLFIDNDIDIKAGSKIIINRYGKTYEYEMSGENAIYQTHQEIVLKNVNKYA